MSKGTSHIIFILISGLRKLLEFRNDQIIASCPLAERTHKIMYFLTAIHTENHIPHLTITELHDFIIEKHSIRCECETEFLIMKLFLLSSVCNQVFDYLPVHQRFPSKEIHLQILSGTGICNQKIQCFLSNFEGHQCTSSVILSFFSKTISTGQITVMCNVQAQCFNYGLSILCKFLYYIFVCISGEKHSLFFKLLTLRNRSTDILLRKTLR